MQVGLLFAPSSRRQSPRRRQLLQAGEPRSCRSSGDAPELARRCPRHRAHICAAEGSACVAAVSTARGVLARPTAPPGSRGHPTNGMGRGRASACLHRGGTACTLRARPLRSPGLSGRSQRRRVLPQAPRAIAACADTGPDGPDSLEHACLQPATHTRTSPCLLEPAPHCPHTKTLLSYCLTGFAGE